MNILFLSVKDVTSKLSRICHLAHELFLKKEKLLIHVPDEVAANFIDQLLWRLPKESFLPHQVAHQATPDPIVITDKPRNWNSASNLLNLCPTPSSILTQFTTVYELLDETDPTKLDASKHRQQTYASAGYSTRIV